jgi:hypothetical protein
MSQTRVSSIKDVLAEMSTPSGSPEFVRDWKSLIPSWSRWHPGDPGDPNCQKCEGTGYIRLEGLPVSHKHFGEIVFCECAAEKVRQWEAKKAQESSVDQLRSLPAQYR